MEGEGVLTDTADIGEEGRTGPAEGALALERDVRRLAADAGDISQTLGLETFGRDGRDGDRNLVRTLAPPLPRHDHVLKAASLPFRPLRLLRRGGLTLSPRRTQD